jgi:hypothetical protein
MFRIIYEFALIADTVIDSNIDMSSHITPKSPLMQVITFV